MCAAAERRDACRCGCHSLQDGDTTIHRFTMSNQRTGFTYILTLDLVCDITKTGAGELTFVPGEVNSPSFTWFTATVCDPDTPIPDPDPVSRAVPSSNVNTRTNTQCCMTYQEPEPSEGADEFLPLWLLITLAIGGLSLLCIGFVTGRSSVGLWGARKFEKHSDKSSSKVRKPRGRESKKKHSSYSPLPEAGALTEKDDGECRAVVVLQYHRAAQSVAVTLLYVS